MVWAIGFVCSMAVAGLAYWKKSLSASGAAAAVVVGTLLYALGHLAWYGTLLAFFISSTLWSRWKHHRKAAAESGYAKGGRRDAGQVAANGGLGALFCVAHALWPHPLWWSAFVGVMAAVNADTWATEIGGLSRSAPRSILTGRVVTAGTSGGITGLGLAASAAGGLFIGAAAWLLQLEVSAHEALIAEGAVAELPLLLLLGLIGGMCGSLTDSLLGATYQAMYRCPNCGKEVEKPQHCGVPAKRIRGLSVFTNDTVNMLSSMFGAAVCTGIGLLLS